MASYRDLVAWQRAMDLAEGVCIATRHFPPEERFALTIQLRRAAVSVPSNIAEGYGRGLPNEFRQFLRVARGSLREAETQLLLAQRLGYGDDATLAGLLGLADETGQVISGLLRSIP